MARNLLIIGVFVGLLAACAEPQGSSEEQIRAWLQAGQAAVEDKDRSAVMDMLSERYTDADGNDRAAIGNLLRAIFLRQQSIELLIRVESIAIYDDSAAEVELLVGMAGVNNSRFGFSADSKRFVLELEREGKDWQLIAANWTER